MKRFRSLAAVLVAFAFFAAACGDDGETASTGAQPSDSPGADAGQGDTDFPVTISSGAGEFTLDAAPQAIVSLSPTATEVLFAIGAGDQVVAVDAFSTFPEGTPVTDLSGFDPNVEAVIGFEPDLVVIATDANDLVAGLTAVGIPVLLSEAPADIESGYATLAELGVATGHVDETATVIEALRDEIEVALGAAPEAAIRVYHELDETFFSASSNGFIGSVYAEMGTTNIADEADTDGGGFPQLTEEFIIAADPELIVITDQVSYTAEDVAARPGWSEISAVKTGNIVVVNADIASRWGPRLPQFIDAVASALDAISANA